jgi:nucleotide-binding universal stress UspA family protein
MYHNILVPVDGSKLSYKALDHAKALCEQHGAKLFITSCNTNYPAVIMSEGYMIDPITPAQWKTSIKARNEQIAKESGKRLKGFPHTFAPYTAEAAWEGILACAKKHDCDLIVMTSHGRSGLSALFLGSVTSKVLAGSKIPVLVCR